MHVIYFFIVLTIINIAMFLLLTQCLAYYKNKTEIIRSIIITGSCLIFTIISALVYSGMIGWNCKENYEPHEWNLDQGFVVSPQRQKCMNEGVCTASTNYTQNSPGVLMGSFKKKNPSGCNIPTQTNMTTLNFPPKLSKNCVGNFDCKGDNYGSGCHKWTVGGNGNVNFPMTYNNWINDPDTSEPIGWPRPDATSDHVGYIPPMASCVGGEKRPNPPNTNCLNTWNAYSTLGTYAFPPQINVNLPTPGIYESYENRSTNEKYTPMFLNCSNRFLRKK